MNFLEGRMVVVNASDPIPAVVESDATGDIKNIFDDIKNVTGVDVVNLVWRRLALTQNALPYIWEVLRPAYENGFINQQAQEFQNQLIIPKLPKFKDQILFASGIDNLGKMTINNILASYNRTNTVNLIALQAALIALTDGENVALEQTHKKVVGDSLPPMPRLPALSDLNPTTLSLVEELNSFGEEDGTIIASMYRHLAYWPNYLALVKIALEPIASSGELKKAIEKSREQSANKALFLSKFLTPFPPSISYLCFNEIKSVLELFTRHPLSKMVVICGMLMEALEK
tara:strand:+ start:663 stop:1523 length:861 start_codon:yes stop_codon:yes gene_type:complete